MQPDGNGVVGSCIRCVGVRERRLGSFMTSTFISHHVPAAAASSDEKREGFPAALNLGPSPLFPWQRHHSALGVGGSGDQAQRLK